MKQWLQEVLGTLVIVLIAAILWLKFGREGLFWMIWTFTFFIGIWSLTRKGEKLFGILWIIFSLTVATMYILEKWTSLLG